ncbi:hypothetical protein CTAYLR_005801 [Chrysophaeum taylorii]|uniref:RNA helicase n=1 Tax=Chrysophaeum taylorii TaxID=2483200 RepID=A0AAD7ULN1_9STRA|nr:hypothetical protein CTAYLR_005801 [Chrysophaeum taylorii]
MRLLVLSMLGGVSVAWVVQNAVPPPCCRASRVEETDGLAKKKRKKKKKIEALESRLEKKFATADLEEASPPPEAEAEKKLAGWGREAEVSFIVRRTRDEAFPPNVVVDDGAPKKKVAKKSAGRPLSALVESFGVDETEAGFAEYVEPEMVDVLRREFGATRPTDIQKAALDAFDELSGDLLVPGPTGSGKTLAFLLGSEKPLLVVTPSRELAAQVGKVAEVLWPGRCATCAGGASVRRQIERLRKIKPDVVVGTPGRLAQLGSEGKLKLSRFRTCVVDEADAAARRPHARDLELAYAGLLRDARLVFVSASVEDLLQTTDAPRVVERAKLAARVVGATSTSRHPALAGDKAHARLLVRRRREAVDTLRRALRATDPRVEAAIVFVEDAVASRELESQLRDLNFRAFALSGDQPDALRQAALREISKGRRGDDPPVLVATELAARGLDLSKVSHVINFLSLPSSPTHYAHRAGRCGRTPGAPGFVLTIAEPKDNRILDALARDLHIPIYPAIPHMGALHLESESESES